MKCRAKVASLPFDRLTPQSNVDREHPFMILAYVWHVIKTQVSSACLITLLLVVGPI